MNSKTFIYPLKIRGGVIPNIIVWICRFIIIYFYKIIIEVQRSLMLFLLLVSVYFSKVFYILCSKVSCFCLPFRSISISITSGQEYPQETFGNAFGYFKFIIGIISVSASSIEPLRIASIIALVSFREIPFPTCLNLYLPNKLLYRVVSFC